MDKNGYETDNEHDNFLMSGGNDLTMSGGNDLTMSGGNDLTMSGGNDLTMSGGNDLTMSGGNDLTMSGGNDLTMSGRNDLTMSGGNDLTMSGGNDLTMSGGNDLTMSGGGCSKPSDGNAYAGFEQLIDDPIIANELGSYKSLFDMFRVGEFEPPERLLGKYILETSTCTSIKKVMKKELTNKIVTHYNEKREDFEQYLKVKIQTYVDKNIPTELKKGYDDAVNKKKSNGEIESTFNPIADSNQKGDVDQKIQPEANGESNQENKEEESKDEEEDEEKEENGEGNGEALSLNQIQLLSDDKAQGVIGVPIAHHDTDSKRPVETSHVLNSHSVYDSDYDEFTGENKNPSTSNGPSSSDKSNKNQNTTNIVPKIVGVKNGDKIAETKNSTDKNKSMGSALSTFTNPDTKINPSTNSNPDTDPNTNPNPNTNGQASNMYSSIDDESSSDDDSSTDSDFDNFTVEHINSSSSDESSINGNSLSKRSDDSNRQKLKYKLIEKRKSKNKEQTERQKKESDELLTHLNRLKNVSNENKNRGDPNEEILLNSDKERTQVREDFNKAERKLGDLNYVKRLNANNRLTKRLEKKKKKKESSGGKTQKRSNRKNSKKDKKARKNKK